MTNEKILELFKDMKALLDNHQKQLTLHREAIQGLQKQQQTLAEITGALAQKEGKVTEQGLKFLHEQAGMKERKE